MEETSIPSGREKKDRGTRLFLEKGEEREGLVRYGERGGGEKEEEEEEEEMEE